MLKACPNLYLLYLRVLFTGAGDESHLGYTGKGNFHPNWKSHDAVHWDGIGT